MGLRDRRARGLAVEEVRTDLRNERAADRQGSGDGRVDRQRLDHLALNAGHRSESGDDRMFFLILFIGRGAMLARGAHGSPGRVVLAQRVNEFFDIAALLAGDMPDLFVDRFRRHMLEHRLRQVLLQYEPPDAAGDDQKKERHQRPVEQAADEQETGMHEHQRHRQDAEPDMGPEPRLRRTQPPRADPFPRPEQQFEGDDQAARDARC